MTEWRSSPIFCSDVYDACDASKIMPPSMLSKAAIMQRIVSERGLQRTPRSKSDVAPGLVNVRAVMMLKSAHCPSLVFGSRLVQLHVHIFQGWR